LESFLLAPWASRRRQDLLELLDRLNPTIEELTAAVEKEGERLPEFQRLMTYPGVGPLTALAFVLIIGTPQRFHCGKQMGSYLGLIPSEDSSADRQRFGHISKQVVHCCAICWWKRPRLRYESIQNGAVALCTSPCAEDERSRRLRWRGD